MPAFHHINHHSKFILTYWCGDANDDDFIDALNHYLENVKNQQSLYSYNEIADFSSVGSIQLTPKGLMKLARIAKESDVKGTRFAIVVSSRFAYAFAKMYKKYRSIVAEKHCKEVDIFESLSEALLWVGSDAPHLDCDLTDNSCSDGQ